MTWGWDWNPKNPFRTGGVRILRDSYRFGIWRLCVVVFVRERPQHVIRNHFLVQQKCKANLAVAKVTTWKGLFFLIRMETGRLRKNHPSKNVYVKLNRIFQFGCCLIYSKGCFFFCFRHPLSDHPFSYSLQDPGLGILLLSIFFCSADSLNVTQFFLVGGWANPFEKYARQIGNLP